jgi:hypothetical protein
VRNIKVGSQFWSAVSVIVPGNFVGVHIANLPPRTHDYEIVNQTAFLQKFFNIKRMPMITSHGIVNDSPFATPDIEIKPEYVSLLKNAEFRIKALDAKRFEIQLDTIRTPVTTYVTKKV